MIDSGLRQILALNNMDESLRKLYKAISCGKSSLAFSLSKAHRAHIAGSLDKFVLYVAKDMIDMTKSYSYLQSYFGDRVAMLRGNDDLLIHRKTSSKSSVGAKAKTLKKILDGEIDCCIVSPQELLQYFAKPNRLDSAFISLHKGDNVEPFELAQKLSSLGYTREESVEEKNTFSLKGDILTVFCSDMDMPIRISFWGDEIEYIKTFDPDSLITLGEVLEVAIPPNNDFLWTKDEVDEGVKSARKDIDRLAGESYYHASEIVDSFAFRDTFGQEVQWLLPYMTQYMATIFDYLPADCVVVLDEPSAIEDQIKIIEQENVSRVKVLVEDGSVLRKHLGVFVGAESIKERLKTQTVLEFSSISSSNLLFAPSEIFDIKTSNLSSYHLHYNALYDDLRNFNLSGFMVIMCCGDKHKAKSIIDNLQEEELYSTYMDSVQAFRNGICVTPIDLEYGFVYPNSKIAVIGRADLSRTREVQRAKKTKAFTMPQVGDYVVHEVHGIGKCLGIQRVKTGNIEQDYVTVEYRAGALLYVPVDQLDRLSRYSGSDQVPKLSAIGGKDFAKIKENVKKSVKKMAINLLDLYSKRSQKIGYKYPEDTQWQREFEDSFEFQETPDQLEAIREAKSDMERGVVMDRLLCGDVGYGKTEVALRVVFKTIMENKQAVILAPTTILAKQHYNTAMARFNDFKIKVELLTRLQSPAEIRKSLDNLATGKSLVAVATHRILSSDVQFHDLGLLVLDEEQRFGVEHKEKLKTLKNNVNVLTLSATPIPRTLNMAMSGIRDMSVLETPPSNRIPVQTSVTELTSGLLQDAIGRELNRGGQVYVLYNRVTDIDKLADWIREVVPQANVVVGHGQMEPKTLEEAINKFYNQEANVLVCTTIIENGIDVPLANTLIVCDADKLGLAQLYQLRGRVGRSNRIAYAYFTVRQGKVLTSDSYKRLSAIMDYTELGSGFKIAMRDLEIRGAGNILGKEQSGHIQKIGYDLYCKLLRESVAELQGEKLEEDNDIQLNLAVDAYISSDYVESENARLKLYRQIGDLSSEEERDELLARLEESYGTAPDSMVNLLDIGIIKNLAKKIGIVKINLAPKGMGVIFRDASVYHNEDAIKGISSMGDKVLITNDANPNLIFDCRFLMNVQKLRMLKEFLVNCSKRA